jgi:hypothetical protein
LNAKAGNSRHGNLLGSCRYPCRYSLLYGADEGNKLAQEPEGLDPPAVYLIYICRNQVARTLPLPTVPDTEPQLGLHPDSGTMLSDFMTGWRPDAGQMRIYPWRVTSCGEPQREPSSRDSGSVADRQMIVNLACCAPSDGWSPVARPGSGAFWVKVWGEFRVGKAALVCLAVSV